MIPGTGRPMGNFLSSAMRIGILTLCVKLLGVGRDAIMAGRFGTSASMDGFLMAYGMVQFAINTLPANIPSALVPALARAGSGTPGGARALERAVRSRVLLICAAAGILASAGAAFLLNLCAPTLFRTLGPELALTFRLLLPLLPLFGIQWCLASLLQAQGHFLATSLAPGWTVLAVILSAVGWRGSPQTVLTAGFLVGACLEVAFLAIAVHRMPHPDGCPRSNPLEVRRFLGQLGSLVLGSVFMNSTNLVDLIVGSRLGAGAVAGLSYAIRLPSGVGTLAITALGTAALSQFSAMVSRNEREALLALVRRIRKAIFLVGGPLALVLAACSAPLTRWVFARGAFTPQDVDLVAPIQAMYFLQLPFYVLSILLVRLISAFERNELLLAWTVIAAGLNLGLDLVLGRWLGPKGVALATTCMYMSSCLYMTFWSNRLLAAGDASR